MFDSMRDEVRNLLLVASELGGEAAQYVKVLRKEKERLLPVDAIQAEMEELKAQAEQASAAEANMFKALTKANDRTYVAGKKAGELMEQLEQAHKRIATLQVTNDEYKEQLTRQAEELGLMQTNRAHAEVYQKVVAERDRALAELRTQEQPLQKELNKQHANLCACIRSLRKELTSLRLALTQRDIELGVLSNVRTDLDEALRLIEVLKGQVEDAESTRDCYNEQLAGWYKWLKEASKEACVSGAARNFYDRDSLLEAIRSLRKDPSAVSLELKKAEDKLFRVVAALEAPIPRTDIIKAAVYAPIREALKDE